MVFNFDEFTNMEVPDYILCNPNKEQLYSLGNIYDRTYNPRYNALSEISFTAPQIDSEYYDYLVEKRLILVNGIGYFIITKNEEYNDGIQREKKIVAQSLESQLSYKYLTNFEGTYKFYDILDTTGTLLEEVLSYAPGWSVDHVDSELLDLYRTFDIDDASIYNFLMSDVEDAYQCIFVFDYLNQTVSAYTVDNATSNSDIFMNFDNLIKTVDVSTITDELVTALSVYGGGDLSINQVNPLGTNTIYDFTYFKSTDWMSQDLVDAITAWEAVVSANQGAYATLLASLLTYNETLITQNSELVDLQSELTALEGVQSARIQQGLDLISVNADIAAKQVEITAKEAEITVTNSDIDITEEDLGLINTAVSFETNFTVDQLEELSPFILGNTYQNENFIQTDIMNNVEIQQEAQELYDQAVGILAKVSQPRYEFSLDAINFMGLTEFSTFSEQLELGVLVTLEINEGTYTSVALLGMDLSFDSPDNFSLIFGNRLRLDDSSFMLSDLLGKTLSSALSTSFNSEKWGSWANNYQTDVDSFINSSLNASVNNVISGSTQDVRIDANGIRVRSGSASGYEPEQLWINNGVIAFTEDSWDTASLALGKVSSGSSTFYGLVADVVVGRLLAGTALTIENEGGTFSVDGSGATLSNATLTLDTDNGNTKILLDPTNGIKIQANAGGTWSDRFYVDSAGNVIMSGQITATSGAIGGWAINSSGLYYNASNYIYPTAISLANGALIISGGTATFSGDIYANKLIGLVDYSQLTNIPASKISAGTFGSGSYGFSGTSLTWNGVRIATETYVNGYVTTAIASLGTLATQSWVYSLGYYNAGDSPSFGTVYASGYYADGIRGLTTTRTVRNSSGTGTTTLSFRDGLYIGT